MQFITAVSKSSDKAELIKQALLDSNPVLEGIFMKKKQSFLIRLLSFRKCENSS